MNVFCDFFLQDHFYKNLALQLMLSVFLLDRLLRISEIQRYWTRLEN